MFTDAEAESSRRFGEQRFRVPSFSFPLWTERTSVMSQKKRTVPLWHGPFQSS